MKLTNNTGLPASIVNAVRNDPYSSGGADISVTKLIQPPQLVSLARKHADEIVIDASESIFSLFGQAVHHILDRADDAGAIHERRLFTKENGWTISGAFDRYVPKKIQDYKVCSVYGVRDGGKEEWEWQQNLLACLARRNGMDVDELEIVAILRDWRRAEMERGGADDYPRYQVQIVKLPVWPAEKAEQFLMDRVYLHQMAQLRGEVPPCTDEERWFTGEQYAVMKKGGKRAVKLHPTREDAEAHANNAIAKAEREKSKDKFHVEHRPGKYNRCQTYCSVADFCPQWQAQRPAF